MPEEQGLEVRFWDFRLEKYDVYDFSIFDVSRDILGDLRSAFTENTGHYLVTSRRQAWRSIRKFALFLSETPGLDVNSKDKNYLLGGLCEYLERDGNVNGTNQSHFNFIRRVVLWLKEESGHRLWLNQVPVQHDFSRWDTFRKNDITLSQYRAIVQAAKADISKSIEMFSLRNVILNGGCATGFGLSESDFKKLKRIIELEKDGVWTQQDFSLKVKGTTHLFGLRRAAKYREFTKEAALPVYVLLIASTAGNPQGVLDIGPDCIEPHPVDGDQCFLTWDKGRGGEQSLPFQKKGKFSPVQLVETIKKMTAPIQSLAENANKKFLFITRNGKRAEHISAQSMHNYLAEFRDKHELPFFSFEDLRNAASTIAKVSTGDDNAVQAGYELRTLMCFA